MITTCCLSKTKLSYIDVHMILLHEAIWHWVFIKCPKYIAQVGSIYTMLFFFKSGYDLIYLIDINEREIM